MTAPKGITILSVSWHGVPDWMKGAAGAVVLAALLGAAFYAGTRLGPVRTHTQVVCAGGTVCRDYWRGP